MKPGVNISGGISDAPEKPEVNSAKPEPNPVPAAAPVGSASATVNSNGSASGSFSASGGGADVSGDADIHPQVISDFLPVFETLNGYAAAGGAAVAGAVAATMGLFPEAMEAVTMHARLQGEYSQTFGHLGSALKGTKGATANALNLYGELETQGTHDAGSVYVPFRSTSL
jgi:hypothetical protein